MRQITFSQVVFILLLSVAAVSAQSTAFTYQGSLNDGASPANGNYDLDFRLFSTVSGGPQQGMTVTANNVAVTNGVFTVNIDFGSQFPGANRYLEIRVRATGGGAFTLLSPRQPVNSTPYSIKSLTSDTATNATQLGGLTATGFIQNTTVPQATSSFNISNDGIAGGTLSGNIVNAATRFNINGVRVLSNPGSSNIFVGAQTGLSGTSNSFVGVASGLTNTTGVQNSFFGSGSGGFNTTGPYNTFVGFSAGIQNTTGGNNSFFGLNAGSGNTTGNNNTIIGRAANVSSNNLSFATAVGAQSVVSTSNTVALGRTSDTVSAPGTLIVGNSTVQRGDVNLYANSGNLDLYMEAAGATSGINFGINGGPTLFISQYDGTTYQDRLVVTSTGTVRVLTLGSAGATALCRNASQELSTCSSSLRYKKNIGQFSQGMSFVNRLRPISFDWKDGGMRDVGFGAEDIAKIDDRFVTYNEKGEVEGVKYDRLSVAFVNAFREQQSQIESQQKEIEALKNRVSEIDELKAIVCSANPLAAVCTPTK